MITIIIFDPKKIYDQKLWSKVTIVTYSPNWSVIYDRKTFVVQATDLFENWIGTKSINKNQSLTLAAALGVWKFINSIAMILAAHCCAS